MTKPNGNPLGQLMRELNVANMEQEVFIDIAHVVTIGAVPHPRGIGHIIDDGEVSRLRQLCADITERTGKRRGWWRHIDEQLVINGYKADARRADEAWAAAQSELPLEDVAKAAPELQAPSVVDLGSARIVKAKGELSCEPARKRRKVNHKPLSFFERLRQAMRIMVGART